MYGIVVDYECIWRPTFYLAICAGIFMGSVLFTLFCLYCIRPTFSRVLRKANRRPVQLEKKNINRSPSKGLPHSPGKVAPDRTNSPTSTVSFTNPTSPKIKTIGKIQYSSLEESPTKTSTEEV